MRAQQLRPGGWLTSQEVANLTACRACTRGVNNSKRCGMCNGFGIRVPAGKETARFVQSYYRLLTEIDRLRKGVA